MHAPSRDLMRFMRLTVLAGAALAGAVAAHAQAILPGTASYLERQALPPDAVLDVSLEDVTRADAPATVVSTAHVEPTGQPPIRFGIGYAPEQIDASHRYAVRASIKRGNQLLFVTDTPHPVPAAALAQGEPGRIDVLLRNARDKP